jgi:hypothetical protein
VQVRHDLNDTPIPGFSIDYDTLTISCDWRGLFSAFYAEELLVNNMRDRAMEQFSARRDAMIADVHAGRLDIVESMKQMLTKYGDETDNARKLARRVRIRRQYERDGYNDWQPKAWAAEEEDEINKGLKEAIFFASFQEFSDEEGGNEKEEEEEEGEENDENGDEEWEDEAEYDGAMDEEEDVV